MMKKLLPNLFDISHSSYFYKAPNKLIKERLETIFKSSGKFLSEPDFDASFYDDSFTLYVNSGAYTRGGSFGSTLYGKIIETGNNGTSIELRTKPSGVYKFIIAVMLLIGLGFLYQAVSELSFKSFLIAIGVLAISPFICNWLAGVANGVVQDRYDRYIDKELRKLNAPNT
jgi:hypothetical protein